jgi:hypothetical protein
MAQRGRGSGGGSRTRLTTTAAAVAAVAMAAAFAVSSAPSASATSGNCGSRLGASIPATTITGATMVAASAQSPEYCRVDGYVTTPGDRTVQSNRVYFQVGLPVAAAWNSRFLFLGTGGLAGHLVPLTPGLERGYATATTDTGHQGLPTLHPELDGSWALRNRPKQIDYAYRGTHVATVAAKAVARAYYGVAPRHSILSGCSNGGRQGFVEAQRFPDDYDGIVADSPAFAVSDMFTSWIWQQQAQLAAPDAWLSPDKLPALSAASMAALDRRDGLADGLVSDPLHGRFNPAALEGDALSAAQVATAKAIYQGRTAAHGRPTVDGHLAGHEETWARYITGGVPPTKRSDGSLAFPFSAQAPAAYTFINEFLRYFIFNDPTYSLTDFDIDTDSRALERLGHLLDATNPDLRSFAARDGKLLVVQGWADPAVSATSVIDYHRDVVHTMGRERTDDLFRLFMAPGRTHCGGGPVGLDQVDPLTAMERWLTHGDPPGSLLGTSSATGRTRPVCAYPDVARYRGHGSIDDAENFSCRAADGSHGGK